MALAGTRLLERGSESAAIDAALDAASGGEGRLLLVEGPAGIGKTTLLDLARAHAVERAMTVFAACGTELEHEFPFGVVRQLFEAPVRRASPGRRERLLDGAARHSAVPLGLAAPERATPAPERLFAAIHGVYWLCANLADGSALLVMLDDAQLADDVSLRFLAFLAQRIGELPVALVIARRTADPVTGSATLEALADIAERCVPQALSEGAVGALVREKLGADAEPRFVATCHAVTGGNPFYVHELLRSVADDQIAPVAAQADALAHVAPTSVVHGVLLRLTRLGGGGMALARAVAILGGEAELPLAARLARLDAAAAARACDGLAQIGVLRTGRPLDFVHPIVRATIVAQMPEAERRREHGRAAVLLDADGAAADRVVSQLLEAEPSGDAWVVERLRAGAEAAMERGAPDVAAARLRRALREPPACEERLELLVRLGSAEALAGQPAALEHLREALAAAPAGPPRAEIARELARLLVVLGRYGDAVGVLEEALAELPESEREVALVLEAEAATIGRLHPATCVRTGERLRRFASGLRGDTPGERLLLANLAVQLTLEGGSAREACDRAQRAIARGLLADQSTANPTLVDALFTLVVADELDAARQFGEAVVAAARASGSLFGVVATTCFLSHANYRRGAIVDAEADARSAFEAALLAAPGVLPLAGAFLIDALVERGQIDEADIVLERCGGEDIPEGLPYHWLLDSRARLRLAGGQAERAFADLMELRRRDERWPGNSAGMLAYRSTAALAVARLGDRAEARRLASEELELARAWGTPRAIGIALRALGLIEEDGGLELLRDAVATLAPSSAALEHVRAQADLGAALRRANRRAEARPLLAEALDRATRLGALALAERCRAELQATGARPRRVLLTGVDALTASERRVAEMAGTGMSNPQIAQALFVTRKTVETHLGSAYRKLGIESRDALPDALAGS